MDNDTTTDERTSGGAGDPRNGVVAGDGIGGARGDGGYNGKSDRGVLAALSAETEAARNLLAAYADVIAGDDEVIASTIEGETDLIAAITVAEAKIAENEFNVEAIKSRKAALDARAKRLETQASTLRTAISVAMEVAQKKRLVLPDATITMKAVPVSAIVTDEADIPSKFWKPQAPKLDKRAVLDALKDGEAVPGATLSNGGQTIQIRRN